MSPQTSISLEEVLALQSRAAAGSQRITETAPGVEEDVVGKLPFQRFVEFVSAREAEQRKLLERWNGWDVRIGSSQCCIDGLIAVATFTIGVAMELQLVLQWSCSCWVLRIGSSAS